jgi:AcrR family transcriptional regulator
LDTALPLAANHCLPTPFSVIGECLRLDTESAGTLYRHFPTRDALIEAVYRNETEQLVAAATRVAAQPPIVALREWLLLFVDYMATKHGMVEALNSMAGGRPELYSASTDQIKRAIVKLIDRASASGVIRFDADPLDLLRALAGVANKSFGADGTQAAKHMVDVLIAGIRAQR